MRRALALLVGVTLAAFPCTASQASVKERLEDCGTVLEEVLNVPEDIPQQLLDKAECVIVIPSVVKVAFVVGGSYGRGAMTCRGGEHFTGVWGAPTMIALEGGSVGFQLGGEATDFVILVMNPRGAAAILKNKVKIGAGASAAAGPKGRDAEADTDITLRAENDIGCAMERGSALLPGAERNLWQASAKRYQDDFCGLPQRWQSSSRLRSLYRNRGQQFPRQLLASKQ